MKTRALSFRNDMVRCPKNRIVLKFAAFDGTGYEWCPDLPPEQEFTGQNFQGKIANIGKILHFPKPLIAAHNTQKSFTIIRISEIFSLRNKRLPYEPYPK